MDKPSSCSIRVACYWDLCVRPQISEAPRRSALLQVFQLVSAKLELSWTSADGKRVSKGTKFGTVRGPAVPLLTAERVALNFLQRMSGIATATARMQDEVQVRAAPPA